MENQDAVITTILMEDEYRVVLTWDENPSDLDAHLEAKKQENTVFHVYWGKTAYYEGDELIAQLDLDDRTGYGPETVTVTVSVDMETKYKYYVNDYSNRNSPNSKELSFSGAKVEVYRGDMLLKTYSVPADVRGTTWNVFEIFNGEVIDTNQVN